MKRLVATDYRPYDDFNTDLIKSDILNNRFFANTLECLSKISNINEIPNNHVLLEGLRRDYGDVNNLLLSDKQVIEALQYKWKSYCKK